MKIDPEFRCKICGVREETPYETSKYQMQPNPGLPEAGGVKDVYKRQPMWRASTPESFTRA